MALTVKMVYHYPSNIPNSRVNKCFNLNCSSSINWKTLKPSYSFSGEVIRRRRRSSIVVAALRPLDLTEDNVRQVLEDARTEFGQIFDRSVGMTGEVELFEVDGPFVKISLKGRFWHERSLVLARLGNYLKQRIPEILEVDIEDEKQLDDSPENF